MLHNLDRTRNFLSLVRPPGSTSVGERSLALASDTLAELRGMTIDDVLERGLHEVATWIVDTSMRIGGAIHDDYFDPKGRDEQRPRAAQGQAQSACGTAQSPSSSDG